MSQEKHIYQQDEFERKYVVGPDGVYVLRQTATPDQFQPRIQGLKQFDQLTTNSLASKYPARQNKPRKATVFKPQQFTLYPPKPTSRKPAREPTLGLASIPTVKSSTNNYLYIGQQNKQDREDRVQSPQFPKPPPVQIPVVPPFYPMPPQPAQPPVPTSVSPTGFAVLKKKTIPIAVPRQVPLQTYVPTQTPAPTKKPTSIPAAIEPAELPVLPLVIQRASQRSLSSFMDEARLAERKLSTVPSLERNQSLKKRTTSTWAQKVVEKEDPLRNYRVQEQFDLGQLRLQEQNRRWDYTKSIRENVLQIEEYFKQNRLRIG